MSNRLRTEIQEEEEAEKELIVEEKPVKEIPENVLWQQFFTKGHLLLRKLPVLCLLFCLWLCWG